MGHLRFLSAAGFVVAAGLLTATPGLADIVQVNIDTSSLAGITGNLAFDFLDGGPPSNTVNITNFTSDGTLGAATLTGGASGSLPAPVTLTDSSFFNEYLAGFTFGNHISFQVASTDLPPAAGSSPDEFSFYLVDSTNTNSLVTTSDPTGADSLFALGMDGSVDAYTSAQVTTTVTPLNPVPEPSYVLLLGMAVGVFGACRYAKARHAKWLWIVAALLPLTSHAAGTAGAGSGFSFTKLVDNSTPRPDGLGNFSPNYGCCWQLPAIDGNWVVFLNDLPGPNNTNLGEIWSYNLATQKFTKLVDFNTPVPGGTGNFVEFTPCERGENIQVHDGLVLFLGQDAAATGCNAGLYTVPVAGGPVSKVVDYNTILPGGTAFQFPLSGTVGLSLSKGVVVFTAQTQNPGADSGIWSANADGSNLRRVVDYNTPYCPTQPCGFVTNLFYNGFVQSGNVVFSGGGIFGEFGWNGLFESAIGSSSFGPILNSTQTLPGDPAPDPNTPGDQSEYLLPMVIDGNNVYFVASDPNFVGSCGGGNYFYGVFQTTLAGGSITKIADTCDSLPGVGAINGANSFEYLAASQGNVIFELEAQGNCGAATESIYAALGGTPTGPVISCGDYLFGHRVTGLSANAGLSLNAISGSNLVFYASEDFGNEYGIYLASPACASNISGQVTVTRGGFLYNRTTGDFLQQVTLKNNGLTAISGPMELVLENLSSDATLADASGSSSCLAPGSPYITAVGNGGSLAPGATVAVTLSFADPTKGAITYTAAVAAGAGNP